MSVHLLRTLTATLILLTPALGWPGTTRHCSKSGPPSVWILKTPYPFQAGTERTFDELYHGPWRARVDITLSAGPNTERVIGTLKAGTVVDAVIGETIVIHPLRFVAARDFQVVTSSGPRGTRVATLPKGQSFWILNVTGEGGFAVWWHCRIVGWDSTDAPPGDPNRFDLLGSNEEGWVKVRDQKSGLSGWFRDYPENDDPKLVPADATTKVTGD